MYELFVALHVPAAIVYLAMLFWHCHNFLTSWHYLFATLGIWVLSLFARLFKLNWTHPWRMSWLVGDEAAVTILPENALKVTIPTQVKWRPGQYVYLRMPGISIFENHPFTVTSLCSEDFPSEYGEGYRDMILVFRPFGGFTRKVLKAAIAKGPYKTYRAFLDGPYGGMKRQMDSFDTVVLVAGGSGVTALVSQLLDLVKRMRDGKAMTKTVHVLWAIKRLEAVDWFKEELRICREYAPPDSVRCHFFVTAAKRHGASFSMSQKENVISDILHDKLNDFAQGIASKRSSALIREDAAGDLDRERELRRENEDRITALPKQEELKLPEPAHTRESNPGHSRQKPSLTLSMKGVPRPSIGEPNFEFGFPETPTMIEKSLVRFAFGVSAVGKKEGWLTEYGRPDLPYMLRALSKDFGKRTCVYVCGPPGMREDVANTVARLQHEIWEDPYKDEIFLHTENYAL
jgi:predicted ferric reductase